MSSQPELSQLGIRADWQSGGSCYYVLPLGATEVAWDAVRGLLGDDGAGRRLYAVLRDAKIRTAILEDDYIDWDYRACFARFLHLRHHDMSRRCRRLHLFASDITRPDPLPPNASEDYRGFVVLRPLPTPTRLGRAVLSGRLLPKNTGGRIFLTCSALHRANLAGNEISFMGVPWMEQDTLVSACASAAIWIASSHLCHRYPREYRAYSTPEITDLATKYLVTWGRSMPSEGLTTDQIMFALREMGYDPVPYIASQDSVADAWDTAYFYTESGIPALITLVLPEDGREGAGHVVTAIGHTMAARSGTERRHRQKVGGRLLRFHRSSDFVPSLVVQDDSGGPFRLLEFIGWEQVVGEKLMTRPQVRRARDIGYPCAVMLDRGTGFQQLAYLSTLIFPLPRGVTMSAAEAEAKSITTVVAWHLRRKVPLKDALFRTFLLPSNVFKAHWHLREASAPASLATALRQHLMFKWVWVTEFSTTAQYRRGKVVGHIIQDSASHANSTIDRSDLLVVHMPGELTLILPDGSTSKIPVGNDHEYPAFSWQSSNDGG